ncbi:MAG TPA: type IV pili twitching motility protein PilT [Opitutae bacterium]|nr:type IV pili twitching motility protein PilT [Opitutae bacterium]
MRSDTHWLLYFCYENSLLTAEQVSGMASNLDASTKAEACAELLTKTGWVKDAAFLEDATRAAKTNAREGYELPTLPGANVEVAIEGFGSFPSISELESMDDAALVKAVQALFMICQKVGVSDLHLTSETRPRVRHHRKIVYLTQQPLPDALARRMNLLLLTDKQRQRFEEELDLDYALTLNDVEEGCRMRFRANLMEQKKGISGVYRIVADHVQTLEELGFPNAEEIRKLLTYHNGIILVTGPVGSGKTTTLASLVHELNVSRKEHIITVEDPIEVLQESQSSIVTQREVGKHTKSFQSALKSALREDPDIIVIGEMRDLATIEMAVSAAETGHLVIATMHTRDAHSTLNRLLDVFPASQQNQIRAMTAGSLRGVLSQRLIPSVDDKVALACELMVNTNAVANIIRDAKDTGLEAAMQAGRKKGMRLMNESLDDLVKQGRITEEVAAANRVNAEK